jgi:hypothetical protein
LVAGFWIGDIVTSNGEPQVRINALTIDEGHVLFTIAQAPPNVDATLALNQALLDWLEENSQAVIRSTLPIVSGGSTWAIHVWFD